MHFDSLLTSQRRHPTVVGHLQKTKTVKIEMLASNNNTNKPIDITKVSINRSKSQKQLSDCKFQAHLHPILQREKAAASKKYSPLSTQRERNKLQAQFHSDDDWQHVQQKLAFNTEKKSNNNNFDEYSLKYSKKQRWCPQPSKGYDQKIGLTKKFSSPNFQWQKLPHALDCENISDYFQEATAKLSTFDSEFGLKGSSKFVEKDATVLNRERDENKRKIIEYASSLENLKLQNQHLKKTIGKGKEVFQTKSKDKGKQNYDFYETKRQLKDEIESKQALQSQRKSILLELNQTLMMHEAEKSKWDKDRKIMQMKIDTLLLQIKEKRNANQSITEKYLEMNCENKKLKQKVQCFQQELREKQKQSKWMSSKVNDLKQALDHLQAHGNERIEKLESQLHWFQSTKKCNLKTQAIIKQKQSVINFLKNEIELKDKQILHCKNVVVCSEKLNQRIRIVQSLNSQYTLKIEQLESSLKDLNQKNKKIINTLNNSLTQLNSELSVCKCQKLSLKNEIFDQGKILQNEREQLKRALKQLSDHEVFHYELDQKQNKIKLQALQIQRLIIKIAEREQVNQCLRLQVEKYKQESSTLGLKLSTNEGKCLKLEATINQLKGHLDRLRQVTKQDQVVILKLKSELSQVKIEIDACQQNLRRCDKQLKLKEIQLSDKTSYADSITQQLAAYNKKLNCKIEQIERIHGELRKCQEKLSEKSTTTSYSQLELRLCATLGMFLTSQVDKIIAKVQQFVSSSQNASLHASQAKLYKQKYSQVTETNKQLSCETLRLKQESTYMSSQNELLLQSQKTCEQLLEEANLTIIKLRMKIANDRFNYYGSRKS